VAKELLGRIMQMLDDADAADERAAR